MKLIDGGSPKKNGKHGDFNEKLKNLTLYKKEEGEERESRKKRRKHVIMG
jgi:hypothetical protein